MFLAEANADEAVRPQRVEIAGGADFSGHDYTWTITNRYTSPLVYLAMPGHDVDVFTVPDGWTAKRIATGFVATAATGAGIATRRDATFKMRVKPKGARRGRNSVIARFSDGTEFVIRNVEVPAPESSAEKFMPLFGLAAMLAVVIAVKRKRARSKSPALPG